MVDSKVASSSGDEMRRERRGVVVRRAGGPSAAVRFWRMTGPISLIKFNKSGGMFESADTGVDVVDVVDDGRSFLKSYCRDSKN